MESCIFSKIHTGKGSPLRLYVTVSNQFIQLTLLLKEKAFKSLVPKEELVYFAEQHELTLDHYCEKLLEYLETDDNSDVIFVCSDTEFVVSILKNTLKVKFFTCVLEKANYVNEVEQIFDTLRLKYSGITKELDVVTRERNEINENKIYCETKLTELVNKKVLDENEKFGQFVLILNEKKRRIQHLEELLEAFKKGRPTFNQVISTKNQRKSKSQKLPPIQKKETISDSESITSEDEQNEDVSEGESGSSNPEKQSVEENKPSTSAELFSLFEDDISHSHSLPKRIKVNSDLNDTFVTKTEPCNSPPEEKNEEMKKSGRSKTPEIELNTQQLLDML